MNLSCICIFLITYTPPRMEHLAANQPILEFFYFFIFR